MVRYLDFDNTAGSALDDLMEGFQLIDYNWKYQYVNNAIVQQAKCETKDDLLGHTMMEKYPGIEHTPLFAVLSECMNERISKNFENEFTFPDGSKGWFELRIQPVQKGIFILSMDITERKRSEAARIEHAKNLEKMIYMTSHKVRQPVAHILGVANLLETTVRTQQELNEIIGYMKQSALSLDEFTKELSNYIHDLKLKGENPA